MPLPDNALDRLRAAFVSTDAAQGDGAPALRLQATGTQTFTSMSLSAQNAITFTHASAQIIPGATSLTFRNTANDASNMILADAGGVTFRGALSGITTLATSSTINSQTISATAAFTGTATFATSVSIGANPAVGAALNLANNAGFAWRNAANNANVNAATVNASDLLLLGDPSFATTIRGSTLTVTPALIAPLVLSNAIGSLATTADQARLGSVDLSAGNATLAISTETAVVTETVTSDRTLSVVINGTTYKICLKV